MSAVAALTAIVVAAACGAGSVGTPSGVIGVTPGGGNNGNGGGTSGGNGGGGSSPVGPDSVAVENDFYTPKSLMVPVGTLVTWVWQPGDVIHTVTFDTDTTIMSPFQSSGTYARKFTVAGTYTYHCSVHGFAMTGAITVQ